MCEVTRGKPFTVGLNRPLRHLKDVETWFQHPPILLQVRPHQANSGLLEEAWTECYEEVVQVETKKKWEQAMKEEMDSLAHNQTWDLVRLSVGKTTLQNKWVYLLKEEDGGRKRYKARLVMGGFAQKKGIDFDEIFYPIVKMTSIRTILSLVVAEGFHLEQLDVKKTFLLGDLEEEIYMQ
eukprot:PITA_17286